MPIKACSRCGLKVLVDAAAAANDNYLCPRCAPDGPAPAATPAPRPAGKRASVKVTCPYCGASFSGSMPSRPAKGGCPVCQKELVLLPDGTIQAAATFNLQAWQKERKSASNPPSAPAPASAAEPVEMPSTPDPLGGSTILDMGGPAPGAPPAPPPTLDDQTMAMPAGDLGGETMLGTGYTGAPSSPAPSIDEPPPPPSEEPEAPPDLGGATILDMGSRPVDLPASDIEEPPAPDLLKETMPGYDRPPAAESPVEPPTPPPIPEDLPAETPPVDVTEGPTVRDDEVAPPEPEPMPIMEEPSPASIESVGEIPSDVGGETILDMGADLAAPPPEPAPSIEEPPPEAVPILAKDIHPPGEPGVETPDAGEAPSAPGQATPKPYVYQPIPRVPRKPPPVGPMGASAQEPPPAPRAPLAPPGPSTPPPPPAPSSPPVLGSDFRIAAAPPAPKPVEKAREESKPAGPKTAAVVLPRAHHGVGKLILAWVLLGLPLLAGFVLHSMQKNPGVESIIRKISDQARPGIEKIRGEIEKAVKTKPEEPK